MIVSSFKSSRFISGKKRENQLTAGKTIERVGLDYTRRALRRMVTLTLRSGDINTCTRVVHAWNTARTHVHAYAQAWQLAYQGIPGTNQSFRSSPIRESCAGSMTHPLIALIRKKPLI